MDTIHYDAIVVGSGATGGMAALTLAEQGIKVLLIEAGPYIPREKASCNEPFDSFKRISGIISKKHKIQCQHPGYWKNNPDLYANELTYPYTFPKEKPFLWTQGKQCGGKSLTWGGITLRLAPEDFEPSSNDGFGTNWPISYSDLSPHYDYVEKLLGIYGTKNNVKQVPDGNYIGEIPLTEEELFFGEQVKNKLKYPFIQSRGFDKNSSTNEAKWPRSSSLGSTLEKAFKTGNVQLLPNHLVESFETNQKTELATKIKVVNTKNGLKTDLNCKLFFLCASTISTLRILLNSEKKANSLGFKDSSEKLGKYLMDHVSVCNFFSMSKINSNKNFKKKSNVLSGAGSFFIPFGREVPNNNNNFIRGYGIWGAIDRLGIPDFLQKKSNTTIGFLISHGEVLPRAQNQINLSEKTDKWNIPLPNIEFNWTQNETKMVENMRDTMRTIIKAGGGQVIGLEDAINLPFLNLIGTNSAALSGAIPPPGYYIHEVGGAPMGNNEENSVLDKWNRIWRCKNVFVLDGSCWPTSSWQSPTLTMMAISRRACLNAKRLLKE